MNQRRRAVAFAALVGAGIVLRCWNLTEAGLTPDEIFSVDAVHRPFLAIAGHLADTDPHPPLSYLLLAPFERVGHQEWVLRLPSALLSIAALVLFARWMWSRGRFGLFATTLFALSPFQAFFASQARMYGLTVFAGVLGVVASERWLAGRSRPLDRWWPVMAGSAALLAAFGQATGVVFALALLLVPGLRTDAAAWRFRAWVGAAVALWGAAWAWVALGAAGGSLYPAPDVDNVTVALNELFVAVPENRWILLALVVAGGVVLVLTRPHMGRAWLVCFVAPVVALLLVSFSSSVFIPKSLVVVSWGAPLAVAALAAFVANRMAAFGWVVVALVLALTLPSTGDLLRSLDGTGALRTALATHVAPGDLVASNPPRHIGTFYGAIERGAPRAVGVPELGELEAFGSQPGPGRLWVIDIMYAPRLPAPDLPTCSDPILVDGGYELRCYQLGPEAG